MTINLLQVRLGGKITTGSLRGLSSSTYLMTIMYKNEATMAIPIALFKHKFTQVSILC